MNPFSHTILQCLTQESTYYNVKPKKSTWYLKYSSTQTQVLVLKYFAKFQKYLVLVLKYLPEYLYLYLSTVTEYLTQL